MNQNNWDRMWDVFDRALQKQGDEERTQFVRQVCEGDESMQAEIFSLIDAHTAGGPLDDGGVAPGPLLAAVGPEEQRIGPYVLLDEAGRGGMGIVYRARDERLHRIVALKMLPPHLSADKPAKTRFLAEARAAARLEHPNIATVYDIGETPDGRLYIAMAYYDGETLQVRIERGLLPIDEAVDVAVGIARGLSTAHSGGVVHRDIKPANILITRDGAAKILDFGIAKIANLNLTRTGSAIGTVAYMSPEQARGTPVDHRSDLWSLGVVLFEMVTGGRPFKGDYSDAVIYSILHEEPLRASALRSDVPAHVEQTIRRALCREPADRFASAIEFIQSLQKVTGGSASRERPLPPAVVQVAPERVRATVLVSHLLGFERLVDELVPSEVAVISERIRAIAQRIVETYDGVLYHMDGESLTAFFGIPAAHEDDFVRAVRAARELHKRVRALSKEIENRSGQALHPATGIDTGLVVVSTPEEADSWTVAGSALQLASQLSLLAESDEILLSPDCERLVRPFFKTTAGEPTRAKGSDAPLTTYRVGGETGSKTRIEAAEKAGLTVYAGRDEELQTIRLALERSLAGSGQFVAIVGEAGLGKSRLLHEFESALPQDIVLLKGRCESVGVKTSYLPFIGMLREHLGCSGDSSPEEAEKRIADRIASIDSSLGVFLPLYVQLLAVESERSVLPDHLAGEDLRMAMVEAISGVFTLSARGRPLVMLLEDWHWSDDASQDVLKQVADLASSHSMLVVVAYRPEYRPNWSHRGHHTAIHLKPLDVASSAKICRSVFDADEIPEELPVLLHQRTGGNPFFLEEICHTLEDEGIVVVERRRAVSTKSLDTLQLPDTVQAVIRTRFHRLDHEARKTLRVASVIGREFSRAILHRLLPDDQGIGTSLETLRETGLIQQIRVLPEASFRFSHVLTQDVVYESLLQHQRKVLHEQVGEAVESSAAHRLEEQLDLLVYHYSRAENWQKSALYGHQAARRALQLSQFPEADAMLRDVRDWLKNLPDEPQRQEQLVDVLLEHERVCETLGARAEQRQIIDELMGLANTIRPALLPEIHRRQADLFILRRQLEPAAAALQKALEMARSSGDQDVERRILRSLGFLRWNEGRADEAVRLNEEVLELHRACGDIRAEVGDLVNLGIIARDSGRYEEAHQYLEEALALLDKLDNPSVIAYVLHSKGLLAQLMGDDASGVEYLSRARDLAETHRLPLQLSFHLMSLAHTYLKQGRVEESVAHYEEAIELSRRSRYADGLAKSLRVFGDVLTNLNRFDEALPYLEEAADCFHRLEDGKSEADTLIKIASIHEARKNASEAEMIWQRIAGLLGLLDSYYELSAVEAFGRIARMRGNVQEALSHYLDAVELSVRAGEVEREGRLRNIAGIIEWQRGEFGEALLQYRKALELFDRCGDAAAAGLMLNSIGVTLQKLGKCEESIHHLRDALEVHEESGRRQLKAHALSALGDSYMAIDRHDDAKQAYADSLQIRWDINDRRGEGWMLHHLAVAHAAQGEMDRSRDYARQAEVVGHEVQDQKLLDACRKLLD